MRALSTVSAGVLTLALASAAVAQGVPGQTSGWTGFYGGVNAGTIFGGDPTLSNSYSGPNAAAVQAPGTGRAPGSMNFTGNSGALAGVQFGYNHRFFDRFVAGVEADWSWANRLQTRDIVAQTNSATEYTQTASRDITSFASLRARLGLLFTPDLLVYGTAGLAMGDTRFELRRGVPAGSNAFSGRGGFGSRTGWVIGAGAELAVGDGWSVKAEYLAFDLGRETLANPGGTTTPFATHSSTRHVGSIARMGLNFRPGGISTATVAAALARPAPTINWTGIYLGAHVGGMFGGDGEVNHTYTGGNAVAVQGPGFNAPRRQLFGDTIGALGGFQAGFNYRVVDHLVAGVEADWSWTSRHRTLAILTTGGANFYNQESERDMTSFASLRARLGLLLTPQLLIYGTGGIAMGETRLRISHGYPTGSVTMTSRESAGIRGGWTIGGGAEFAFGGNLSVKAEYLAFDLGRQTLSNPGFGPGFQVQYFSAVRHTGSIGRLGLNFRL